jgi:hypothetical protein
LIVQAIAIALLVVGLLLFAAALAILFPYIQREARADAETIRAARLKPTKTDHDIN